MQNAPRQPRLTAAQSAQKRVASCAYAQGGRRRTRWRHGLGGAHSRLSEADERRGCYFIADDELAVVDPEEDKVVFLIDKS